MKKITLNVLLIHSCFSFASAQEISGKAILAGLRARTIGPASMSGRIADIDVVNKKPEIIYAATAGGGVWKSISAGANQGHLWGLIKNVEYLKQLMAEKPGQKFYISMRIQVVPSWRLI